MNKDVNKLLLSHYKNLYGDNYLEHHGVKGQKWGVRRYQKKDGTLTTLGKAKRKDALIDVVRPISKSDRERLSIISGKNAKDISEDDARLFGEDVSWSIRAYNFNKGGLSFRSRDDVKKVAKDYKEQYDRWIKESEEEDLDYGIVSDNTTQLKSFRDKYVKPDPEAYAKQILEESEALAIEYNYWK